MNLMSKQFVSTHAGLAFCGNDLGGLRSRSRW